jgi:A/G-specific adenine glycosylase
MKQQFADRVLAWFDKHGRRNLPWQHPRSPYRVWISEIMLQQTQVTTVIPYFERFQDRFPDVEALAAATLDEVLHLWSGLGYYARGRNLHRAAREVVDRHGGWFPADFDSVQALPGIGRSTAGAILALSRDQRHAILDGNVKRVLARHFAIEGWSGENRVSNRFWEVSEGLTPVTRVADYTQAIMDLGATVCVRNRPTCDVCPLADTCLARRQGQVSQLPTRRPKKAKPVRSTVMLILRDVEGRVLLEQRPQSGIWGGLWSFPECPTESEAATFRDRTLGLQSTPAERWRTLRHTFTHFHLDIVPLVCEVDPRVSDAMTSSGRVWYNPRRPDERGLAAPVNRLIAALATD